MVQTHETSETSISGPRTPEVSDVKVDEVTEELAALRAIVDASSHGFGEEYFQTLVRTVARTVDTRWAFIAQFSVPESHTKARTIAFWDRDHFAENFEWTLAGTPCEDVVSGKLCHYTSGVRQKFPDDPYPRLWGIESFLGVPLCDSAGTVLGHLAAFDDRPMPEEPRKLLTFRIFASHAAAELTRLHLERQLRDSVEQLRDLYDEAPIAYVKEDLESRFISANRAA